MKTILLTGSNGLLGQKLVNLLRQRPAVRLVASSVGPNRVPNKAGYEYEELDITQFEEMKRVFEAYGPTEVINTAAMTNVDECEKHPERCEALNITAVKHLCGLCKEVGARLIHISTDFIFDGEAGPYDETAEPRPLSAYGHSKWKAEQAIKDLGVDSAILRTVLVYGTVPGLSRSNIVLWVKQSLEAGKPINVVQDQWRTPTLAEDLADGVAAVVFRNQSGVFNISGAEFMSVFEMANRVADFWGLDKSLIAPIDSATLAQPAKRPPRTGFIIYKAQTELAYKPHTLEQGLAIVNRQLEA